MRARIQAVAAGLAVVAGCSEEHVSPVPIDRARTIDVGNGYVAVLSDDGGLEVSRDGQVVLRTAAGVPLFAMVRDDVDPDGWHDPASGDAVWAGVSMSTVEATSPTSGQLRLVLPDQGAATALVSFAVAVDDGFYTGLGERFDHVDAGGAVHPMHLLLDLTSDSGTNETHVPVPLLVSSRGYGVFVASREAGAFRVGVPEPDVVRAAFEGRSLDVTLFFDPDPLAVVAAYTKTTGLPRRPPLWALAPMHWRNEWADAETVLADAAAYRERHIPASCLWIDNPWQTAYNTAVLDPGRFGDTAALMGALAAKGFRPLAWSTPYLEKPSDAPTNDAQLLYQEGADSGYFVRQDGGGVWPAIGCCYDGALGMIDFTNAPAVSFWKEILSNATSAGFAGFKLDYGEDLIPNILGGRLRVVMSDGQTERTARTYPLGYHASYHAALDEVRDDGFLLGRASAYGGQAVLDAVWPGDLDNDFTTHTGGAVGGLPAAIVAAQTLSASGFPVFGSDTGGYRGGKPTREALLRWAEHTAFSMVMQLGGGGDHHNPWLYDEEAASIYASLARTHMRLVPYLAGLTRSASETGAPTIRALPLAYPSDAGARAFADTEYLLGPDLLVAPVVEPGATSREVHVPPGRWVRWWYGEAFDGPDEVVMDAALGAPIVLLRAGALVPLLPEGIDTLVDATEPGIVTLAAASAAVDARALVTGHGAARYEDGSKLSIDEDAEHVTIAWSPIAPAERVVLDMDLRSSSAASVSAVTNGQGAALAQVADEAAVRACPTSCYAVADDGARLWLMLSGETVAQLAP